MTDARPRFLTRAFFISKVKSMHLKYEDGMTSPINKEEIKDFVFKDTIRMTSTEAKEKILYKDGEGNCSFLFNGKEVEGVILTLSSKGDLTIGIKEV